MSFRRLRYGARPWGQEEVKRLLQAELEGDSKVHGDGFAVQRGRLVLPLAQRVHGGLVQQGRAGNDLHRGYVACRINQRVEAHVAGYVLNPRQ